MIGVDPGTAMKLVYDHLQILLRAALLISGQTLSSSARAIAAVAAD